VILIAGASYKFSLTSQPGRASEPFFSGLGSHTRKVTTRSPLAQRYFDQGLAFLFGFNHEEAIRSFEAATVSDPNCAMAYWGIAMANGPDINNMATNAAHSKAAWRAVIKARQLASQASPVERALINAVCTRYSDSQWSSRKSLDQAYAHAMREVLRSFPDDADVGALTAEALIDLRPWRQWTRDGKPQPGTEELLGVLNATLARHPMHPFALHLLIHAVEEAPNPELGDVAADRLRDLMPGLEHILHMPSHLDVRRGRWREAVTANEKAIAADQEYRRIVPRGDVYQISMAHNHHMLAFAAMMQGDSQKATRAISDLLADIPESCIRRQGRPIDGFFAMPYEVHLRFGRWDQMLREPAPRECFPITTALWHYARGVAYAAKNQIDQARAEESAFLAAKQAVPEKSFFRKTSAAKYLGIAEKMLAGEILYREKKVDEAISALRVAVEREESLHYTEPPNWIFPVRHALGATLLDAGRYADAETVYREDLKKYPENGWSLYGLGRSLRLQGKAAEASAVAVRFQKAWEYADVKLTASCFCLGSPASSTELAICASPKQLLESECCDVASP
jgi:tetratricopeptide (TPR) repeat protein